MLLYLLSCYPRLGVVLLVLVGLFLFDAPAYAVSTTDVVEMFKYTYGVDRLMYLASQEIVLWNILSRRKQPIGGRGQWIIPIRTRNAGVWRGHLEGGAKTTRRAQPATIQAAFSLQEFHGVWDISWKMLQDARKDEYAFERAVDMIDNSFRTRVYRLLNADLLGRGRGELGILPAADNATTVTVRSLPLVDEGMIVDLMDSSDDDTKLVTAQPVTGINIPGREISHSGAAAAGTAAGDYYTVADSVSIATGSLHTLGILNWLSDENPAAVVGNIGGLDRTTNTVMQASVFDNGGTLRPLTEDLTLEAFDTMRERGGTKVTDIMSNLKILRRYHAQLREDMFFAMNGGPQPMKAGLGFGRDEDGMKSSKESEGETIYRFSGIPWRAEPFLDANTIIGFDREHFFIGHGENEVPQPLSEIFDDMVPYFTDTANTTFEVINYWQGELLSDNPQAGFAITDIAES